MSLIYLSSQAQWTVQAPSEVTEQNQLPSGPHKITAEESLVQENNFKEIAEAQTILNKVPIMITKSDLLIGIGFGRHCGLMVNVLVSGASGQGLSLSRGHYKDLLWP